MRRLAGNEQISFEKTNSQLPTPFPTFFREHSLAFSRSLKRKARPLDAAANLKNNGSGVYIRSWFPSLRGVLCLFATKIKRIVGRRAVPTGFSYRSPDFPGSLVTRAASSRLSRLISGFVRSPRRWTFLCNSSFYRGTLAGGAWAGKC